MTDYSGHTAGEWNPFGSATCRRCGQSPEYMHVDQWTWFCPGCCPCGMTERGDRLVRSLNQAADMVRGLPCPRCGCEEFSLHKTRLRLGPPVMLTRLWCALLQIFHPRHLDQMHITCQHWQGSCWWCPVHRVGTGCNSEK